MGLFKVTHEFCEGAIKVISPTMFPDHRGYYVPTFRTDDFAELGLPTEFVQDNHSGSKKNVLRGLHFQLSPPMGKLMRVTRGEAMLVAVDLRSNSPTFLKWISIVASEANMIQVWAPAEFARGFLALSDTTDVQYKCTALFNPASDKAIRWNDPDIGINWGIENPILSVRDKEAPTVRDYLKSIEFSSPSLNSILNKEGHE